MNNQIKNYSVEEDTMETDQSEVIDREKYSVGKTIQCQFGTPQNLRGHYPKLEVEILERRRAAGRDYFVVKPVDGTPIVGTAFVPDKKFKKIVNTSAELYAPRFEEFDPSPNPPSHRLTEKAALQKLRT